MLAPTSQAPSTCSAPPTSLSSPSSRAERADARPVRPVQSPTPRDSCVMVTPRSKRSRLAQDVSLLLGDSYEPPRQRRRMNDASPDQTSPLPWMRSGRRFTHPLVVEAVTMQISALSEFQLSPDVDSDSPASVVSSQRTETAPSSPTSPATTIARSDVVECPVLASPTVSTVTPRTPQRDARRVDHPRFQHLNIPDWFAEAFESDGYDSEALAEIERLPRATAPSDASPSPSSPGFELVADSALRSSRDEWVPDVWPPGVKRIAAQFNPRGWRFPRVLAGSRGGAGCGCVRRCSALTCVNARQSRFCTECNCSFAGVCGNAINESSALSIRRNTRTGMRGLVATRAIPAGEVIGQYLGHVQLFGPPCRNAPANEGFRMHLKIRTTGNKYIGIDALEQGGLLRLMNHSCNAAARFHEVQTGGSLTVVGVTVRDVYPGKEVTVSYGSKLWFLCRCGWWGCQHRHLQHLAAL
ncbi:hypothetical protein PR001_g27454 [Phytophthora rubi]|uniref:SET domain-containing protein n=1 Tax=Phytophthora rubi TaxID=129364 RepID=A0A6A3HJ02_9STRA|nr:hypothetical protein PR001_g27454 [Phytophthora rubi]